MKKIGVISLIALLFAAFSGCSKSDDGQLEFGAGFVSYRVDGKLIEYTKANSFLFSGSSMDLSFSDGGKSAVGLSFDLNDPAKGAVANVANAGDITVMVLYKGPETTVLGYNVANTYIKFPELNKKGSYTIKTDAIKDNRASGSFEFVAYSDDNRDSVVVTQGIFRDIPNIAGLLR